MGTFAERQAGLGPVMRANSSTSGVPHVVIALPSFSVGEAILSHYGDRLMALEHRYLVSGLMAHRLPHVDWVYVGSLAPGPEVVDYYRGLGPDPQGFTDRSHVLPLEDRDPRPVAAKLLDHPETLRAIERVVAGRPSVIEPWNVSEHEMAVGERLNLPINGTDPALRRLGFKSDCRRLFSAADVRHPVGCEDVRTVDDVLAAVGHVRRVSPSAVGVVVKHDDSGAGDGNVVVDLSTADGRPLGVDELRDAVSSLPEWYLGDLLEGGIVEERIVAEEFASPSVQLDVLPDGTVRILATHEQVLGGESGQVFQGCEFPADHAYARELAEAGLAIGRELAAAGAVGRASVDFVAGRTVGEPWELYALEVNLRKGGTTHPYTVLRNLVPGAFDPEQGIWRADADGLPRAYVCTDNLVEDSWRGVSPAAVIGGVRAAGLEFDHVRGCGVVLHMLSGLAIDGRFGLTAIAPDREAARVMTEEVREVVARLSS